MRGKGSRPATTQGAMGITPAYAGKRLCCALLLKRPVDHPRICGEKTVAFSSSRTTLGSPPHMRGKEVLAFIALALFGITPAYAGKSLPAPAFQPLLWDHPRICGEKRVALPFFTARVGSPPHMRGKAAEICALPVRERITPAYAGKSYISGKITGDRRDHPRICGEKGGIGRGVVAPGGSPPHMRGKD